MDFSQTSFNEEEIPLEYDTSGIDRQIETQNKMDPTGESQKPLPTYWKQIKNSYNQSKLVDYESSARNAYRLQVDAELDLIDDTDRNKELMKNYKYHKIDFFDEIVRNKYKAGDWSYDYETNKITFNNDSGRELERFVPDTYEALEGFALSLKYESMDDKVLKNKAYEDTRKKYLEYETELQKDSFTDNFGSQFIGNVAAYLTDPVAASSLALELGTLGIAAPFTRGKMVFNAGKKMRDLYPGISGKSVSILKNKMRDNMKVGWKPTSKPGKDFQQNYLIGVAGAEATIGGLAESYQQDLSFDFKHNVLPEFTEEDKNLQIGLVAGASGMLSFIGASISHGMMKHSLEITDNAGAKAVDIVDDTLENTNLNKPNVDETHTKIEDIKDIEELNQRKQETESALNELEKCLMQELR